ncbi:MULTISPECIES: thioesterase II family protein [unclassified Streptomyces]|uniref:thioesterase II family protein n=1 Tax=unclassified Streptomyces TaxID=2593676 RepID=UPI0011CE5AAB|nr:MULTISPECIES: alpha/beta fold hydrolase [unclassified Streptomyces]TXS52229.1 thioesterase [Streptomyces sp. me109]
MPTDAPSTPWLRRFHTAESGALRLFCFPHAGGNASFFHPFSARLTPRTEVLAVQYPGRQERFDEPRVEDLHELADLVAAELAAWAEEPFALFGHSMGATLAFEVGSRLHARGARPTALFVSGRRAPSVPAPGSVHLASDEKLIADMRLLGGTDNRMLDNLELLAVILPAVRSDYVATETYRYRGAPPLDCPVTAFIGDADPRVDAPMARAWAAHTTEKFLLHVFEGGHFFLVPHLDAMVDTVTATLNATGDRQLFTRN